MKVLRQYFMLGMIILFLACNSNGKLTGKYSNQFGDKVVVKKDKTYLLKENIDNKIRITKGIWQTWSKDGVEKIQFINIPFYKIASNYTLNIEQTINSYSSVKIYYSGTDSIIPIPFAYGLYKTDTIGLFGLHTSFVKELTFSDKLDSLFLSMWKYKDITINIPDTLNHNYILRFYPTETISSFDRIFNVVDHQFQPIDSKNPDKRLRFKKHGA